MTESSLKFAIGITSFIPYKILIKIPIILAPLLYISYKGYLENYRKNNLVAFKDKPKEYIENISRQCVISKVTNMLLALKLFSDKYDKIKLTIDSAFNEDLKKDAGTRPIIVVIPHIGPTFIAAKKLGKVFNFKSIIPFRRWKDNESNMVITKYFTNEYQEVVLLGGAGNKVGKVLENNGVAALSIDAILPINHKTPVKFFGKNFFITTGPVWLAEKYNAVIYIGCTSLTNDDIVFKIYDRIDIKEEIKESVLPRIVQNLEEIILSHPGQWNTPDSLWE